MYQLSIQRNPQLKKYDSNLRIPTNTISFNTKKDERQSQHPNATLNAFYNFSRSKQRLFEPLFISRTNASKERLFSFNNNKKENYSINGFNSNVKNGLILSPDINFKYDNKPKNDFIDNPSKQPISGKNLQKFKIRTATVKPQRNNFLMTNLIHYINTQNNENKNPNANTNIEETPLFSLQKALSLKKVSSFVITSSKKNGKSVQKVNKLETNDFSKELCKKFPFTFEEELGKGSYAIVYLMTDNNTKQQFAVKTYKKEKMNTKTRRKIIEDEIAVLQICKHKNIMKFIRKIETSSEIHLVLEYIRGKSLASYLKTFPNQCLPEQKAKSILAKILDAIVYLHANNIYHRDLKLDNILINESFEPIVIDFGFSCISQSNQSLNLYCGTPNYMSPEIVNKKEYLGGPNDAWSFGVLFYRVIVGVFPFASKSTQELNKKINKLEYFIPRSVSPEAKRVIESLLITEESQRSSLAKLKSFRFFLGD